MEIIGRVMVLSVLPAVAPSTGPGRGGGGGLCDELSVVRVVQGLRGNGRVVGRRVVGDDTGGGEHLLRFLVARVHVQIILVIVLGGVMHQRCGIRVVQVHETGILKGLEGIHRQREGEGERGRE